MSLNWYKSRQWCKDNGGELASFHSKSDTDVINEWVRASLCLVCHIGLINKSLNILKDRLVLLMGSVLRIDYCGLRPI